MTKLIRNTEFNTASHCVYRLSYHIVFCTKFRRNILTSEKRTFLFENLRTDALEVQCKITELKGRNKLFFFSSRRRHTRCLSKIIGKLKSKTASVLLDEYGACCWGRHERTIWSSGFFICSTGGAPLDVVKAYIENQGRG